MLNIFLLIGLALCTAAIGTLGGLGGAVFLVPALILSGVDAQVAAPLGLLSVAAGSLAAGPKQLGDGVVHHRLGVTLGIAAGIGSIVGARLGNLISATALSYIIAAAALFAAFAGIRRKGLRNVPKPEFVADTDGEWPGTLGGVYHLDDEDAVPYQAERVPQGMLAMIAAGLLSGLAGVGGGFIQTPAMTEIMHVPVKVAAATTTFTVGVAATTGIIVFAQQGRIDYVSGCGIVLGGLIGGVLGSRLQAILHPTRVRRLLTVLLVLVAVVLIVRSALGIGT